MACWTNGWKNPEVSGAVEEALEENNAKFDHFVDTGKAADAINDSSFNKQWRTRLAPCWLKDQRRGGVGDHQPCTSNGTLEAKERCERRSTQEEGCDREGGEPRAKAEDERQTHGKLGAFRQVDAWQRRGTRRQEADLWRGAQRSCKKKRSGRSTSAVEDAGRTRNGSKKALVPDTCQKTPVE